ncbi:MAG: cbb3-type cytochrome oxidase assembly protein CcoS [Chloroflexi bacterium]|nr:cbb3-type cytochrome oxidase assembly protein CcoS [Chloroflexota bacterium]MBI3761337.1 cbb3-type cytochrome oxidase assembly protein CcoS [Chloroflexota bacterium]
MILPGTWLVLATLAVMLILFWLGWFWARAHGQFDDVEAAKHAMIENERSYRDDRF